jgi:hypothetical protein
MKAVLFFTGMYASSVLTAEMNPPYIPDEARRVDCAYALANCIPARKRQFGAGVRRIGARPERVHPKPERVTGQKQVRP